MPRQCLADRVAGLELRLGPNEVVEHVRLNSLEYLSAVAHQVDAVSDEVEIAVGLGAGQCKLRPLEENCQLIHRPVQHLERVIITKLGRPAWSAGLEEVLKFNPVVLLRLLVRLSRIQRHHGGHPVVCGHRRTKFELQSMGDFDIATQPSNAVGAQRADVPSDRSSNSSNASLTSCPMWSVSIVSPWAAQRGHRRVGRYRNDEAGAFAGIRGPNPHRPYCSTVATNSSRTVPTPLGRSAFDRSGAFEEGRDAIDHQDRRLSMRPRKYGVRSTTGLLPVRSLPTKPRRSMSTPANGATSRSMTVG